MAPIAKKARRALSLSVIAAANIVGGVALGAPWTVSAIVAVVAVAAYTDGTWTGAEIVEDIYEAPQ